MTVVIIVCLTMLAAAGLLALIRVIRPGISLADRAVAVDLVLLVIVTGIAVTAAGTGESLFLDVLVVVSLLAFVGTITVARFIERRGL